ncbi:MAG: DUF4349 domain-containing protein [Gemmataceae bacterium]|nr:DUF4349 domain-containing protein [Gemmataceae bacterium]
MPYLRGVFLLVWTSSLGCAAGYSPQQDFAKAPPEPNQAKQAAAGGQEAAPRKLIYTATIELIVEDFDWAEEELTRLVQEMKGYVAASDLQGERGVPRSGQWTLRVPVAQFDALVAALTQLGEARRNKRDSQDITENYYDLKERLKTFHIEEEGLRKLYQEKAPTSKLEELAVLRRELTQIRAQIEEMTGKLKRWDNQVELATVVVTIRDRKDYVPPMVPDFGGSVGRAFEGSIHAMVSVAKGLVLVVVALAPWLVVLGVLGAPVWWRLWRTYKARPSTSPPQQPVVTPPPAPSA